MHHFCTYFDAHYLSRGLALYQSLRAHCPQFRLWVLCLDDDAFTALNQMRLPGLQPISLGEFESGDTELLAAKRNRSRIEYYFTCTPSLPLYVLAHCPQADRVTYLDADLFFFTDPEPLFAEMGSGSIAIVAHRFAEDLRHLEKFGIFNVGWVSFTRDANALACLRRWRSKCIEWCYDREEDGRFADQKYLDAWPAQFPGLVVLGHSGANVAPWNLTNCRLRLVGETVYVDHQPLVFFHFHGFKLDPRSGFDFNLKAYGARMTSLLARHIVYPYVRTLAEATETARRLGGASSLSAGIRARAPRVAGPLPEGPRHPNPGLEDDRRLRLGVGQWDPGRVSGLRMEVARFWLKAPAAELEARYAEAGGLHQKISTGSLKDIPLSAGERELAQQVLNRIHAGAEGQDLARFLLVAMLYLDAHDLPPDLDWMRLPEWLRYDGFRFQLSFPNFLNHPGETESYCRHLERVVARLHEGIRSVSATTSCQKMAVIFAEKASLQPLYFSRRNLKTIACRRADIVDYATRLNRQDLEYVMPPRAEGRSKIRLGIHCWSLRAHTETYATLPVFANLDPREFEVHLYVHNSDGNSLEQRARCRAKSFTVLPEPLKACVETMRSDDLDILVFGNNITAGAGYSFSLSNYRLARVQCIHFCNPVTSGKRHVDRFLLGKLIAERLDTEAHFSEKILTLEGSGICFDLPDARPAAAGALNRRDLGIPERATVFISGANYFKIIPELRHTWAKILAQVPDSVLLLYPFGPAWSHHYPQQRLVEGITRVFDQYGVSSERLIVMDTLKGREEILAFNRIADVYLDAVPYNGATSLLEPLQEGVPPVVVDGRELRFAQGAAILRELGLPELVTADEEGYIRLAVQLAVDAGLRTGIGRRIRERVTAGPAFLNPRLYTERVSQAFRSLFPELRPQPSRAVARADRPVAIAGRSAP